MLDPSETFASFLLADSVRLSQQSSTLRLVNFFSSFFSLPFAARLASGKKMSPDFSYIAREDRSM